MQVNRKLDFRKIIEIMLTSLEGVVIDLTNHDHVNCHES